MKRPEELFRLGCYPPERCCVHFRFRFSSITCASSESISLGFLVCTALYSESRDSAREPDSLDITAAILDLTCLVSGSYPSRYDDEKSATCAAKSAKSSSDVTTSSRSQDSFNRSISLLAIERETNQAINADRTVPQTDTIVQIISTGILSPPIRPHLTTGRGRETTRPIRPRAERGESP